MKILHVADIHGNWAQYAWIRENAPRYDAVVIAGDLVDMLGTPEQLRADIARLKTWIRSFPVPLLICSGNHDAWANSEFGADQPIWLREMRSRTVFVDGDRPVVGGLRFSIIGWDEPVNDALDADVVICHAPSEGASTATSEDGERDWGDFELANELQHAPRPPWLLLGGHVHQQSAWMTKVRAHPRSCWSLNPGCDRETSVPRYIVLNATRYADGIILRGRRSRTCGVIQL